MRQTMKSYSERIHGVFKYGKREATKFIGHMSDDMSDMSGEALVMHIEEGSLSDQFGLEYRSK